MYFKDRTEAGEKLSKQLAKYKGDNCTLVALSDGAVVLAAQVAKKLECPITMLLAQPINAPGESIEVASINQEGGYSQNSYYTKGEQEEFDMEYHGIFEQEKMDKLSEMHRQLGKNVLIKKSLLKGRTVILISDGMGSSATIDSAAIFLKSIKVKKLVIAAPFAAINVVDKMHLMADEIVCLNTIDNFMGVDHYYDNNNIPPHETVVSTIQYMLKNWI